MKSVPPASPSRFSELRRIFGMARQREIQRSSTANPAVAGNYLSLRASRESDAVRSSFKDASSLGAALACACCFFGRARTLGGGACGRCPATQATTLARRAVIFRLAAPGAALLAAMGFLVHSCPSAARGFLL